MAETTLSQIPRNKPETRSSSTQSGETSQQSTGSPAYMNGRASEAPAGSFSSVKDSLDSEVEQISSQTRISGGDSSEGSSEGEEAQVETSEQEEQSQENQEDEEQESEEETEEEAQEEEAEEEQSEEEGSGSTEVVGADTAGIPSGEDESEAILMLAAQLPSMAPIRTPFVASPPKQALERRDEIIKRTGSPPELHHAQVRQAAEQVTQIARDEQRRMLARVKEIAGDTRLSINDMADEVARATRQVIGFINARIDDTVTTIETNAGLEIAHVRENKDSVTTVTQEQRDGIMTSMYDNLKAGSQQIQDAEDIALEKYRAKASQARTHMSDIPGSGAVGRVNPLGERGVVHPDGEYRTLTATDTASREFISEKAGETAGDKAWVNHYVSDRATAVYTGRRTEKDRQLQNANEQALERLTAQANEDQFMITVLGLTNPVSEHYDRDQGEARQEAWEESHNQLDAADYYSERVVFQLEEKARQAKEYCEKDLRPKMTSNLRKQGKKAEKMLRQQAKQAEIGLNSSAASMAEDYRNTIRKLDDLLAPGHFHDASKKVPQILMLREQLVLLVITHEDIAQTQADNTKKSLKKVKEDQVEGLWKSAHKSAPSIVDVATRNAFDMALFAGQNTGAMRDGASESYSGAQQFAEQTAAGITSTDSSVRTKAMKNIEMVAASLLNAQLEGAEGRQFNSLTGFMSGLTEGGDKGNGQLGSTMTTENKKLHDAAVAVNSAMPDTDWGTLGAGAALYLIPGTQIIGAVAIGVAIYNSDPEENRVVQLLSGGPWPFAWGVKDHFDEEYSSDMQDRIRDRLSDPFETRALGTMAASAGEHAENALEGMEESGNWWNPINRETREAMGRSISDEGYQELLDSDGGKALIDRTRESLMEDLDEHEREIALAYVDHNRERAVAARTRESLEKSRSSARWGWIFSGQEAVRRAERGRIDALKQMQSSLREEMAFEGGYVSEHAMGEATDRMFQEHAALNAGINADADDYSAEQGRETLLESATRSDAAVVLEFSPLNMLSALNPLSPITSAVGAASDIASGEAPSVALPGMPINLTVEQTQMSEGAEDYMEALVNERPGDSEEDRASQDAVRTAGRTYELQRVQGSTIFGQYGEAFAGHVEETFGIEGASELLSNDAFGSLSEADQTILTDTFENRRLDNLRRQLSMETDPEKRRSLQIQYQEEYRRHQQSMQDTARALGADEEIYSDPEAAMKYMEGELGAVFARADNHFAGPIGETLQSGWSSLFGGSAMPLFTPEGYSHATYGIEMIRHGRASLEAGSALATEGLGTHEDLLRRSVANRSQAEKAQANERWNELYGEDFEVGIGIRDRELTGGDLLLGLASPIGWLMLRGSETSGDFAMELEVLHAQDGTDLGEMRATVLRHQQQRVRGTGLLGSFFMDDTSHAHNLDESLADMGRLMLENIREGHPDLANQFRSDPAAIFSSPEGQRVVSLNFNSKTGEFQGDRMRFHQLAGRVETRAVSYRNELDRQESIITGVITTLAMIATAAVTIAAMFVPGLNVAVASMAVAIISGTAVMAVKLGMRGERYGWEEAATDAAVVAIEAATAGIGGALGGGASANGPAGLLVRMGAGLNKSLGKVGGAIVRESIVATASGMAQTAIRDETWNEGFARGIENMMTGGLRAGAVAGITAGASEVAGMALNKVVPSASRVAAQFDNMPSSTRGAMAHGREALVEAASEFIGTTVGEAAGLGIDYARGTYNGDFWQSLQIVGEAALRDAASGAIRGASGSFARSTYRNMVQAARDSDVPMTREQLTALHQIGRAAGALEPQHGLGEVQRQIDLGRQMISALPAPLQTRAKGMDLGQLEMLHAVIARGDYVQGGRKGFMRGLEEAMPGIDSDDFMRSLDDTLSARRQADEDADISNDQAQHVRDSLSNKLDSDLQSILRDQPVHALKDLGDTDLALAADMIAKGRFDGETANKLFNKAKAENADVDQATFFSQLYGAVQAVRDGRKIAEQIRIRQHDEVMSNMEEDGRGLLTGLEHQHISMVRQAMEAGEITPAQRQTLLEAARKHNPDIDEASFNRALDQGINTAQEKVKVRREAARQRREQSMSFVAPEQRGILSNLPNDALLLLRIKQKQGEGLSRPEFYKLLNAAIRENPDIDIRALSEAMDTTLRQPPPRISEADEAKLRQELLAGIPKDQQGLLDGVPILVLRDAEFEAMTRSQKGRAVTMIVHGQPVVVMREGADPVVLREEGIHVLQSKDPKWADRVGSLDERTMSEWDSLPLSEQLRLYRNKLDLEINAQHRLIDSLEADIKRSQDPAEIARLRTRLEITEAALGNLLHRQMEVRSISAMDELKILAGQAARPKWLDQPARLFEKETRVDTEPIKERRSQIIKRLTEGLPENESAELQQMLKGIGVAQLRVLADPAIPAATARSLLTKAAKTRPPGVVIGVFARTMAAMTPEQRLHVAEHFGSQYVRDHYDYAVHLNRLISSVGDDQFSQILSAAFRGGDGDKATWLSKQHLESLAETAHKIGKEGVRDVLVIADDPAHIRNIFDMVSKQADPEAFARDMVGILINVDAGEKRRAVVEWLSKRSGQEAADVINGLNNLRSYVVSPETFSAMIDAVMSSSARKIDVVRQLSALSRSLDMDGRYALAKLTEHLGAGDRADTLLDLLIFKQSIDGLQQHLDDKNRGMLFNLMVEMAASVATDRGQWKVFMDQAFDVLHSLRDLPPTAENQALVRKVLDYLYHAKRDSGMSQTKYEERIAHLAFDLSASAKQLRQEKSTELLSLPERQVILERQAKNLDKAPDERHLAGKDPWAERLAAAGESYSTQKQKTEYSSFASLMEQVRPNWDPKQWGTMLKLAPWFEHLATMRGLNPRSNDPAEIDKLKSLLTEALLRPELREQAKRRGLDLNSTDPAEQAQIATLRAEILAKGFGKTAVENVLRKSRFTDLQRAFREMAVEADITASSSHTKRIQQKRAEVLARMGLSEAELKKRKDYENLQTHLETLIARQLYYERMGELAGDLKSSDAGIAQNITETRGEIALTIHIVHPDNKAKFGGFVLAMPFGKGTGFDQVWIRTHNGQVDGRITEVLIGEAKGPNAKLGDPNKGPQMSARWVAETLREMSTSSNNETRELAKRLLEAQLSLSPDKFRGIVVEAIKDDGPPPRYIPDDITEDAQGKTGYDFSDITLTDPKEIEML